MRSFHYDENTEILDTYVTRIGQVEALLGYGEPQILDIFKNTLPNIYYIDDLRLAVEKARRILTKEKIDRQLVGQSTSTTPFLKVSEGYYANLKIVSFNTQDRLDDKIDKHTLMMSKLTAQGDKQDSLSLKYVKEEREDRQSITMTKLATRPEIDLLMVIGRCHLEIEIEVGMHKTVDKITDRIVLVDCKTVTEMTLGEEILGRCKIIEVSRITEVEVGTVIETFIEIITE